MSFHQATFPLDTLTLTTIDQATTVAHVMDEKLTLVTRRLVLPGDDPHGSKYAPAVTTTVEGQTAQYDGCAEVPDGN